MPDGGTRMIGREAYALIISGAVTLLLLFSLQQATDFPSPDAEFFPDQQRVIELHEQMSSKQLQNYRTMRFLDMLFPLAYGIFFALSLRRMARRAGTAEWLRIGIVLLPAAGMLFDYTENILLIQMLAGLPETTAAGGWVGWATQLKWLFLLLTATAAGVLGVMSALRARRQRAQAEAER